MMTRADISLRRQVAELTKIGIALSSEHDLEKLLSMIVAQARRLLNCDAGSLYTVEEDHLRFRVVQCGSTKLKKRAAALQPLSFKIDKSRIATYVALTGRPVSIPDVYEIPRNAGYTFQQDMDALTHYSTRSMLAMPIRDREQEIIGVLQLINALDGKGRAVPGNVVPFSKDYEDLALALASQAGVAMRNAQLLEDLRALFHGIVGFSAAAIDARDPSAVGHSRRVSELVLRMARAVTRSRRPPFAHVAFSDRQMDALRYAGWLHDVGKIAISEELLRKGQRLVPHKLDLLRSRFVAIRQVMINAALEEKLRLLRKGNASQRQVAEIERKLQERLAELEDDLAFIVKASGSRPLTPKERQRLSAIAAKSCVAPAAGEFRYLTEEELEHLSVPYGTLTAQELTEVRRHARETGRFLSEIPFRGWLKDTARLASLHHEMMDGSGYPYGLKGKQVPIEARMLAIADVFDAITAADRPYRKAMSLRRALKVLRDEAKRDRFDRDLVDLFCRKCVWPFPVPADDAWQGEGRAPE